MIARWLPVAVVALAICTGCASFDLGKALPKYMPRESPRMTAARFQLALAGGEKWDAFQSMTKASREIIGYTRWKLFMPFAKIPETDVGVIEAMREATVDVCYEVSDTKAEVTASYEKVGEACTIYLFLEDEEWKVGLVESFDPGRLEQYEEEQRKKREEEGDSKTES